MDSFSEYYKQNRKNLEAILFDVDGTLISGYDHAMPNAEKIIDTLNKDNFPYFIFTNGVTKSNRQKAEQLQQSGLNISEERIISSGNVLQEYFKQNHCAGQTFFQCGDLGEPNFAESVGVHTVRSYREREKCSGVIIGGSILNYRSDFEAALNLLMEKPHLPCLTANPDALWGAKTGIRIGDGSMAKFLTMLLQEFSIDIEPIFLGKPHAPIYQLALQKIAALYPGKKIHPEKIIALGDYPPSDVAGANNNGFISGLVLTGMANFEIAKKFSGNLQPQEIFSSL